MRNWIPPVKSWSFEYSKHNKVMIKTEDVSTILSMNCQKSLFILEVIQLQFKDFLFNRCLGGFVGKAGK